MNKCICRRYTQCIASTTLQKKGIDIMESNTLTTKHRYTLHEVKDIFNYRYTLYEDIINALEHYEITKQRAYGCSCGISDTIAKLGCRVQTSKNTEYNALDELIILEESIVTKQSNLQAYDDILHYIVKESGISKEQERVLDCMYFTEHKQSYESCARLYTSKYREIITRHDVRHCINRIFNNFIIPLLDKIDFDFDRYKIHKYE